MEEKQQTHKARFFIHVILSFQQACNGNTKTSSHRKLATKSNQLIFISFVELTPTETNSGLSFETSHNHTLESWQTVLVHRDLIL